MIGRLLDELADRRLQLGLSQHEVAYRAKINPAMMSHIERGRRVPSLRVLTRVAAALELEIRFTPAASTPTAVSPGGRVEPPTGGAR